MPGLQFDTFGIDADASPIPVSAPEKPGRIKAAGVGMIGIHVRDCIGFRFDEGLRIDDFGEDVLGLEINDAAETGDQMRASHLHSIK